MYALVPATAVVTDENNTTHIGMLRFDKCDTRVVSENNAKTSENRKNQNLTISSTSFVVVQPHHQHPSSPSTIFIHRQRASSVWTIVVGRRLRHLSSSAAVVIRKRRHLLSVDRSRGPRSSSSPTTDVEDGRQLRTSSTSTVPPKTFVNREVHRHRCGR